jgi:hypothetical protein
VNQTQLNCRVSSADYALFTDQCKSAGLSVSEVLKVIVEHEMPRLSKYIKEAASRRHAIQASNKDERISELERQLEHLRRKLGPLLDSEEDA